jgi:hypothetical protein
LALLDQLLHHTFVPRIRYLGFTTRGKKGPLTTTGDLYACESQTNFDTIINRQQSALLQGELGVVFPFELQLEGSHVHIHVAFSFMYHIMLASLYHRLH